MCEVCDYVCAVCTAVANSLCKWQSACMCVCVRERVHIGQFPPLYSVQCCSCLNLLNLTSSGLTLILGAEACPPTSRTLGRAVLAAVQKYVRTVQDILPYMWTSGEYPLFCCMLLCFQSLLKEAPWISVVVKSTDIASYKLQAATDTIVLVLTLKQAAGTLIPSCPINNDSTLLRLSFHGAHYDIRSQCKQALHVVYSGSTTLVLTR